MGVRNYSEQVAIDGEKQTHPSHVVRADVRDGVGVSFDS